MASYSNMNTYMTTDLTGMTWYIPRILVVLLYLQPAPSHKYHTRNLDIANETIFVNISQAMTIDQSKLNNSYLYNILILLL